MALHPLYNTLYNSCPDACYIISIPFHSSSLSNSIPPFLPPQSQFHSTYPPSPNLNSIPPLPHSLPNLNSIPSFLPNLNFIPFHPPSPNLNSIPPHPPPISIPFHPSSLPQSQFHPSLPPSLPIALYEKAELASKDRKSKHLVVAVSSDRGLCGSIHTNIAKNVKAVLAERPKDSTTSVVCIGDKVRNILQRQNRQYISMVFTEVGRRPPVFMEASWVAQEILNSGYEYDSAEIVYSKFKYVCGVCVCVRVFVCV